MSTNWTLPEGTPWADWDEMAVSRADALADFEPDRSLFIGTDGDEIRDLGGRLVYRDVHGNECVTYVRWEAL